MGREMEKRKDRRGTLCCCAIWWTIVVSTFMPKLLFKRMCVCVFCQPYRAFVFQEFLDHFNQLFLLVGVQTKKHEQRPL